MSRNAEVLITAEGFTLQIFGRTDEVDTHESNRELNGSELDGSML